MAAAIIGPPKLDDGNQPLPVVAARRGKDCSWPETRDRRASPKLYITVRSKPASDCFRKLDRNGALGQKPTLDKEDLWRAMACMEAR